MTGLPKAIYGFNVILIQILTEKKNTKIYIKSKIIPYKQRNPAGHKEKEKKRSKPKNHWKNNHSWFQDII